MIRILINLRSILVSITVLLFINGCSTTPHRKHLATIEDLSCTTCAKRGIHIVDKGESLHSIAFGYGRDYRKLAADNHIVYPYKIVPGQKIYLNQASYVAQNKAQKIPKNNKYLSQRTFAPSKSEIKNYEKQLLSHISWAWPLRGKITSTFNDTSAFNKGIDIAVNSTSAVNAAADGVVVYQGAGLKGYGKLIIIKHSDEYLSAYANNDVLQVTEGQKVTRGQKIAEVGNNMRNLHFEMRKYGKPVNPLAYLPS